MCARCRQLACSCNARLALLPLHSEVIDCAMNRDFQHRHQWVGQAPVAGAAQRRARPAVSAVDPATTAPPIPARTFAECSACRARARALQHGSVVRGTKCETDTEAGGLKTTPARTLMSACYACDALAGDIEAQDTPSNNVTHAASDVSHASRARESHACLHTPSPPTALVARTYHACALKSLAAGLSCADLTNAIRSARITPGAATVDPAVDMHALTALNGAEATRFVDMLCSRTEALQQKVLPSFAVSFCPPGPVPTPAPSTDGHWPRRQPSRHGVPDSV